MSSYELGTAVRIGPETFTNLAGALVDPTTVTLEVRDPNGTVTAYTALTSPAVVQDSLGIFHLDLEPGMTGAWFYRWVGTGADATVATGWFTVTSLFAAAPPPIAFATADELAVRLARTFDDTKTAQVDALLADATAGLRSLIGQHVTAGQSTLTQPLPRGEQWIALPQLPIRSVDAVSVGGVTTTAFEVVEQQLLLARGLYDGGWYGSTVDVQVTYSHGLTVVPADLKAWAIVLGSQLLAMVETTGALAPTAITSETMGSYSVGMTGGAEAAAAQVPPAVAAQLRASYGQGAYVTSTRGSR